MHYDKDCTPVKPGPKAKADIKAAAKPACHPFDPNCAKFSSPAGGAASGTVKDGIILPDPHCDPEFDANCKLRRAPAPAAAEEEEEPAADQPAQEAAAPRLEDFLKGVMSRSK